MSPYPPVEIRRASFPADAEQLLDLWFALYPWVESREEELVDMRKWFSRGDAATFVAVEASNPGSLIGYADVGARSVVDGCAGPAAFLEAWYVRDDWRRRGVGEALIRAVEQWAREQGFTEMGSDALLDNTLSHRLHKKFGFEETDRVVQFRKRL